MFRQLNAVIFSAHPSLRSRCLLSPRIIETKLAALAAGVTRTRRVGAATLAGTAVLAALALALVLAQEGLVRTAAALVVLSAVGGLGAFAWQGLWRAGRAGLQALELATARLAERLAPELGTAASSAVDFSRRLADERVPFSRELAEEHLERTARALERIDLTTRLTDRERRRQRQRYVALGAAAVLALFAVAGLAQGRRRLTAMILDPTAAQLVDVPLAADIRITYRYPAYTGLPERVVEGGDGSISAVVGTEVELSAVADEDVRSALLKLDGGDGAPGTDVPMQVDGRKIAVRFPLTAGGRYHFALTTRGGDKLEERRRHVIHATPDAYPEISMLAPMSDVELRDDQVVPIAYAAKDDFGVATVDLVVEVTGTSEPKRIRLAGGERAESRREGTYRWSVAELELAPGTEGRFFLEAVDNDVVSGPKRASSASRRLVLFSAQKHHADLMARQQKVLGAMVDWLGGDLVAPYPASGKGGDLEAQRRLVEAIARLSTELQSLVPLLHEDKLTGASIAAAFGNVREHVQRAERERANLVARLTRPGSTRIALHQGLAREQRRAITQLEKDVIYLDDLLAIERIDELKRTARDLLAAQRELGQLLEKYKQTQDPALKAELTARMRELKEQMLGLLARMAAIKQQLPGEYRNLEAASQLAVGDQLERIERALEQGDIDTAARELEQLANMVENMSDRLGEAEEEFGGERYAEMRQQLAQFAQEFERLEGEQQALARRAEELAKKLRDQTIERAGANIDAFVKKAREKTGQALSELDGVQVPEGIYGLDQSLDGARQRLLDLDGLLAQRDFAEAVRVAEEALKHEGDLELALGSRTLRYGPSAPEMQRSAEAVGGAEERTREVADMLAKLFPDASEVLSKEQLQQMRGIGRKQAELEREAGRLSQRMAELAQDLPLFGGEPKASLESARSEMGQGANDMETGEVPGGARHGRRAADELGKLRQALEQASKSGRGGLPLPLAMQGGPGREGEGEGGQMGARNEEVHIPDADKNRAAPQFRKELLEAAKQKPPVRYEDAVRRYYEELIR